jgi:hypothetical protein
MGKGTRRARLQPLRGFRARRAVPRSSPVGRRNEPSLRFGLLAFAPSAPEGQAVCSPLRALHGTLSRPEAGEYSRASEPVKAKPYGWLRQP